MRTPGRVTALRFPGGFARRPPSLPISAPPAIQALGRPGGLWCFRAVTFTREESGLLGPPKEAVPEEIVQDGPTKERPRVCGWADSWKYGSQLEKREDNEKKHAGTNAGEKAHRCNKCGNSAATQCGCNKRGDSVSQNKVAQHQRSHKGEQSDKGPERGKGFFRSTYLTQPRRERSYPCGNCEDAFCQVSDLVQHLKTHSEEKNYRCNECGKDFYSSSGLSRHRKFHTGVKLFQCNECDRAFHKNKQLTRHQKMHNGDKLLKCKECGKAFFENKALSIHQKIHSEEKPYECQECGKTFRRNSHLTRHQKTHL
ncbi:zinc finger protein 717-like isoform X2 [Dromiciops gliroides]|uniref:zinc finger protein 717-like isoform X2 n=1 Tax=Dromiciops gliroides TaxID=33562 RepID=UPI001CC5DCAB|nr:zinc finger protein 717-like isoform X2 [Dromiciops gliroides]